MSELEGILLSYERVSRAGPIAALASVVSVRRSTYRRIGAHMRHRDGCQSRIGQDALHRKPSRISLL